MADDGRALLSRKASSTAALLTNARTKVREAVKRAEGAANPDAFVVAALGGPEQACTYITLASFDVDADGNLSAEEADDYKNHGAQLVESTKNFRAQSERSNPCPPHSVPAWCVLTSHVFPCC